MKLVDSHNRVIELMSRFEKQVEYSAAMSKTDINRAAQTILIPLFEEIYGYKNLKNLDYVEDNSNYPSIDLGDEVEKIAFQITSTTTVKKIQDTLQKFVKYNLHQKYNRLVIYILTNKQETYSDTKINQIIENTGFSFDVDNDVWDHKTLLKEIGGFQVEKIDAIKNILEKNFGDEVKSNSLKIFINSQIECLLKQQGINTNISYTTANPILDIPPAVENLSPRKETVKLLIDSFENYSWVAIHGSVGLGKTQLAILIAQQLKSCYAWIRFHDMTIEKVCIRLDAACSELIGSPSQSSRYEWYSQLCEKIGSGAMIVLDDLPRFSNSDELSERLIQLANACEANQVKLLSTSHFSFPNSFVSSIGQKLYQLNSPPFKDFEASEIIQAYGASLFFANRMSKFINALAHQHPLLINAIVKYLADQNWQFTEKELDGLFKNDYLEGLNDETIERVLSTIEEEETKELLYRLILIDGYFSLEDVQELSFIEPLVKHPNDKLNKLIGVWIQRDANRRLIISPLIKRLNKGNLLPITKKNCHLLLGNRIISKHQLTQIDVLNGLNHFYCAEEFNLAGTILMFALGQISCENIQTNDNFLCDIWIDRSLPNQMDLSIRILLRGLQIIVRHNRNKDISYLINDLEMLLQNVSPKEYFAIVGATLHASIAFAKSNPVLANHYLLTSLRFLPQAQLPDGSGLTLFEETQPEQLIWMTSRAISTIEHLNDWIETVKQLTANQRHNVFTSKSAEEGCFLLLDKLYRLEKAKTQDQQEWNKIINAIEEFANQAHQLEIELLYGCAIRWQITILAKHCSNLDAAISLAEIAISQGITDKRALLLVQECIGRYCLEAHRHDQALVWLSLARNLDVNAYSSVQLDVLLNLSFAIGETDPQNAIQYLLHAVDLAKSSESILEENLARTFGEIAIAHWLAGDLGSSFDALDQACEILLAIKVDTDDWKELFVRFGHVSGYLTSVACNAESLSPSSSENLYSPPVRAYFFNYDLILATRYRTVLESSFASQLARYAGVVGQEKQAIKWAIRGIDIARQSKQFFALPTLAEYVVPHMILDDRYDDALSLAQEAGNILSEITRIQQSQNGEGVLNLGLDLKSLSSIEQANFRKEAEQYVARVGLMSIVFQLSKISIEQPNIVCGKGIEVSLICRQIAYKSEEQHWSTVAELIENIYSNRLSINELFSLGKTYGSDFKNEFLKLLWTTSYLAASLQSDISLEEALKAHLYVIYVMNLSLQSSSPTYRYVILPFLVTFWKNKFEKMRFRFRSPQIIEVQLAQATTLSYEQQAQAIFKLLMFGLNVSNIPKDISSWLQIKP